MEIRENSVLPVCAMRYALGRRTYISADVISEIVPLLTKLGDNDILLMVIDLECHLNRCREKGAWSIDDYEWQKFYEAVERERKRRDLHRD